MGTSRRRSLALRGALVLVAAANFAPDAHSASLEREGHRRPVGRAIFFGSSTTFGASASRPEWRWSSMVARRYRWAEVNRGLSGSKLTELGDTIPSAQALWEEAIGSQPVDVVFVMYGANDIVARVPLGEPAAAGTFRHAAREVLHGIRHKHPEALLIVCTPQPARAMAGIRAAYDRALIQAAREVDALVIDARRAFPEENLDAYAADEIHLNDRGHRELAGYIVARLKEAGVEAK